MLVVAQDVPWPIVTGSQIRLGAVITALSRLGEVELFCFAHSNREDPVDIPDDPSVARATSAFYTDRPITLLRRLAWVFSSKPLNMSVSDFSGPRETFASWVRPPYDLVWFGKAFTYDALGRPQLGPTIVDLDDLEDKKILARLAVLEKSTAPRNALHARAARLQARLDVRRWRQLQASIAESAETVVVCSELDAVRNGALNAAVVPNGYDEPAEAVGRVGVGDPPTVMFAGLLFYPPNADAAHWLVEAVLPELQRLVANAEVRLVGSAWPAVQTLHDPPAVTVTGRVPDMVPELRHADVVAVPIRYGSGTRVKILEAFAHRVPVVSTTLGAEGLGVEHERQLLLADTAADFAAACARLITDEQLRARLVDEAERHFKSHHLLSHTQDAVIRLAERHLASASAEL